MSNCKVCDRCDKRLNRHEGYNLELADNLLGFTICDFDLCKKCREELDEFMKNNKEVENG